MTVNRFPQTRQSLIQRIVDNHESAEWKIFLDDYWGPIVRFAARRGRLSIPDAEDITAEVFIILLSANLLSRWLKDRRSKLSTMLCAVVKNMISNRARVQSGRENIMAIITPDLAADIVSRQEDSSDDSFYSAWADELLRTTLQKLQQDYLKQGRVDAFRVFYGKVIEGLSNPEIANCLNIKVTDVENYYKRVRGQFSDRLKAAIEGNVRKYGYRENFDEEVELEWQALGEYLKACGDLESVFQQISEDLDELRHRERKSKAAILHQLTSIVDRESQQND